MEEKDNTSASDVSEFSSPPKRPLACYHPASRTSALVRLFAAFATAFVVVTTTSFSFGQNAPRDSGIERVRKIGRLLYGSDMDGGGPYAYPDSSGVTGFEVELMSLLGKDLGVAPVYSQGQWDKLLQVLGTGRVDAVINGYEWTQAHGRDFLATRPYYVFQLQLMARRGGVIKSWADLKQPKPGGGRWKVGVLVGSAANTFASDEGGTNVDVVAFDGVTDAMLAVQNGQFDATLQDLPAALFYQRRYPGLVLAGTPFSRGFYVIYVRKEDASLRDALDQGLGRLISSGELRRLYEKYGIWTEAQHELSTFSGPLELLDGEASAPRLGASVFQYRDRLIDAAAP